MKNLFFFISLSLLFSVSYGQMSHNSKRFQVDEYYTIGPNGKYELYKTHGFVENVSSGQSGRIFIMPILEIDAKNIKYFDSDGYKVSSYNNDIYSISIPIKVNAKLPSTHEIPAIGYALEQGTSVLGYYRPPLKNDFGQPLIHPNAMAFAAQINQQTQKYEEILKKQNDIINKYQNYKPELVSLSELEIKVKVGNEIVYDESYYGTYITTSGELESISINKPINYIKNRIASGDFSVYVSYKFRDSKSSFIDVKFDAKAIVNQFMDEAQQSMVRQKSSGWSFLGFGSRRKSIRSSFNHTVKNNYSGSTYSSTSIEMFDADERMIEQFENAFFPTLSKSQAIENHLNAAKIAEQQGNTELQKIHENYVLSLQNNDPNLEVDIAKAVAALSKKDYVGFIANGVRWGDYKASGNSDFRRVINDNYEFTQHKDWNQTKRVSIQHSITEKVSTKQSVSYKGGIGLIDGIPHQFYGNVNEYGFVKQKLFKGIILGPIIAGSPLHKNNIIPGIFLISINGYNVYDAESLTSSLKNVEPDEQISLTFIESNGPFFVPRTISLETENLPDFKK